MSGGRSAARLDRARIRADRESDPKTTNRSGGDSEGKLVSGNKSSALDGFACGRNPVGGHRDSVWRTITCHRVNWLESVRCDFNVWISAIASVLEVIAMLAVGAGSVAVASGAGAIAALAP